MDEKLKIKILGIIITKNCNFECIHCMRGNKELEYISNSTIDNILSQVKEIGFLNLTGGEPFLAPKQIEYIVNYIIKHNIKIEAFSIITNGTIYNPDILDSLKLLSTITINDKYDNALGISEDYYHNKEVDRLNLNNIRNKNSIILENFCKDNNITFSTHNIADNYIVQEGRGNDIHSYKKNYANYIFDSKYLDIASKEYSNEIIIDTIGNIFISSDVSYETIKNKSIGNINDDYLFDILEEQYNECNNNFQKVLCKN